MPFELNIPRLICLALSCNACLNLTIVVKDLAVEGMINSSFMQLVFTKQLVSIDRSCLHPSGITGWSGIPSDLGKVVLYASVGIRMGKNILECKSSKISGVYLMKYIPSRTFSRIRVNMVQPTRFILSTNGLTRPTRCILSKSGMASDNQVYP